MSFTVFKLCQWFVMFTFMRHSLFTLKYIWLISYVAGKNLDWYLGHKYAHNAYYCTRRLRQTYTLKDDERFPDGLVRNLKIRILNSVGKNCRESLNPHRSQIWQWYMVQPRVQHSSQFDIVYIWISKFNTLNKALLQYIIVYLNIQ